MIVSSPANGDPFLIEDVLLSILRINEIGYYQSDWRHMQYIVFNNSLS